MSFDHPDHDLASGVPGRFAIAPAPPRRRHFLMYETRPDEPAKQPVRAQRLHDVLAIDGGKHRVVGFCDIRAGFAPRQCTFRPAWWGRVQTSVAARHTGGARDGLEAGGARFVRVRRGHEGPQLWMRYRRSTGSHCFVAGIQARFRGGRPVGFCARLGFSHAKCCSDRRARQPIFQRQAIGAAALEGAAARLGTYSRTNSDWTLAH